MVVFCDRNLERCSFRLEWEVEFWWWSFAIEASVRQEIEMEFAEGAGSCLFWYWFVWVCWLEFVVAFLFDNHGVRAICCLRVSLRIVWWRSWWPSLDEAFVNCSARMGGTRCLVSLFVESVPLLIGVRLSWEFGLFGFLKFKLSEFCLMVTFFGQNHNPRKVMFWLVLTRVGTAT